MCVCVQLKYLDDKMVLSCVQSVLTVTELNLQLKDFYLLSYRIHSQSVSQSVDNAFIEIIRHFSVAKKTKNKKTK